MSFNSMSISTLLDIPPLLLDSARKKYETFAKKHPEIDKVFLIADHLFRLMPMISLMETLPFSPLKNCSFMLAGSMMYAVTVERFCKLRFTILSCIGAVAFNFAKSHAFEKKSLIPLGLYAIAVIKTVYFPAKTSSCCTNKFK